MVRKTPRALTSKLKSQSASVRSSAGRIVDTPALAADDVEPAEFGLGAGEESLDGCAAGHVDGEGKPVAKRRGGIAGLRLVDVGDCDPDAFRIQATGDGGPDSRRAAGDERGPS